MRSLEPAFRSATAVRSTSHGIGAAATDRDDEQRLHHTKAREKPFSVLMTKLDPPACRRPLEVEVLSYSFEHRIREGPVLMGTDDVKVPLELGVELR